MPSTLKLAAGLLGYGLLAALLILGAVKGSLALGWLPRGNNPMMARVSGGLYAGWMLTPSSENGGPRAADPSTALATAGSVYISATSGTEVRSLTAGVVRFSESVPGFGQWVTVGHQDLEIAYMHLSGEIPTLGAAIMPGQRIGNASRLGDGLGSGVMIEVSRGGEPVPLSVLGLSADDLMRRLFP